MWLSTRRLRPRACGHAPAGPAAVVFGIAMLAAFAPRLSLADDAQGLSWIESHSGDGADNLVTHSQLTITDDGAWVVVCREREQSVFLFKRDFNTGQLKRCGRFDLGTWNISPRCIAIAPRSRQCFVGGADGSLFKLDIHQDDETLRGPAPLEWQSYMRTRRVALTEINGLVAFGGGRRVCAIDISSGCIGLLEFEGPFCHQRSVRGFSGPTIWRTWRGTAFYIRQTR